MQLERSPRPSAWRGFIAVCVGMFMLLLDGTVLNVAQRSIRDDFDTDLTAVQWVIDIYLIAFTVPLLLFGWAGDRFGQRRVFALGTALFVSSSALCALAGWMGGPFLLIAARVLQGIGGAAMLSQVLALVVVLFAPERRAAAFGIASALGGLAAFTGPLVGGVLVELAGWESVFLINLPVGIGVLWGLRRYLPSVPRSERHVPVDLPGILFSGIALSASAFALIESGHRSWMSGSVIGAVGIAAIAAIALIQWERRTANPMVPLSVFRDRHFVGGMMGMIVFNLGYGGIMLPLSVYLQDGLGESASEAGRALVPLALGLTLSAPLAGRWSERIGPPRMMAIGFLLTGSMLLVTGVTIGRGIAVTAGLLGIVGIGVGMTISQANTIPMRSVPAELSSRASGVLNLARMAAMTLSIAIVPTIFHGVANRSSGQTQSEALAKGATVALTIAGMTMLLGAVLSLCLLVRPASAGVRVILKSRKPAMSSQ